MNRKLFGTDGIRGVAGEYPLDAATMYAVGIALGRWVAASHGAAEIVVGMDTRESGAWIARHVAAGLAQQGVRTAFAGLISTPGVAYLARTGDYAAGVMISASHNPYRDNGVKVLDHSGFKLPDATEHAIEQDIFAEIDANHTEAEIPLVADPSLCAAYVDFLASTFEGRLDGMHLVVDAAHGSASHIGPALLERLGARVTAIASAPNGRNINLDCGSLHLERLSERVLAEGADLGVGFDGDADRALFVSHSGKLVDGDAVMLITALAMKQTGHLIDREGRAEVVATVMSNLGLEKALERNGIAMLRTAVGDKYVLEEMERRGARLGGEQSGHVIFREFATTGDGILTALRVLDVIRRSGSTLDELTSDLTAYPQKLVNVRVSERKPLTQLPKLQQAIADAEAELKDSGRVLVRFSGTEPLLRVMVEAQAAGDVERVTGRLVDVIHDELGRA